MIPQYHTYVVFSASHPSEVTVLQPHDHLAGWISMEHSTVFHCAGTYQCPQHEQKRIGLSEAQKQPAAGKAGQAPKALRTTLSTQGHHLTCWRAGADTVTRQLAGTL